MARKKRRKVTFGGEEIPELYIEKLRGNIVYYFKNEKGNKIRREDLSEVIKELNKYKERKQEPTIPLLIEMPYPEELRGSSKFLDIAEIITEKTGMVPHSKRIKVPFGEQEGIEVIRADGVKCKVCPDERYEIPKSWLLSQFRKMLEDNPKLLSQELGIEEISYLSKIQPKKSYTLTKIGTYYFERERFCGKLALSDKVKREVQQYWKEFCRIAKVKNIGELDKNILNNYNSELTKVANQPSYRPQWLTSWQKKRLKGKKASVIWIKARLDAVKTVLRNALNIADYTNDIEEALRLCQKTFYNVPLPKVIVKQVFEREHIETIYSVLNDPKSKKQQIAYIKWKAIILLALNCAFTPVDFSDLTFTDINLDKKELSMVRKKKNTERYAVLWDRTVEAIKDFQKIRPTAKSEYKDFVFINQNGVSVKSRHLSDDFKAFLEKVKERCGKDSIPASLTFKYLRKSASSSAERTISAHPNEVKYLMGHEIGIGNHYTHRATDLVANVCRQIEKDFFPSE